MKLSMTVWYHGKKDQFCLARETKGCFDMTQIRVPNPNMKAGPVSRYVKSYRGLYRTGWRYLGKLD
jgi:hypothetical protein